MCKTNVLKIMPPDNILIINFSFLTNLVLYYFYNSFIPDIISFTNILIVRHDNNTAVTSANNDVILNIPNSLNSA